MNEMVNEYMESYKQDLNKILDKLQDEANKRDDIIRELEEAHTSTANEYQPCIMTV